MTLLHWLPISIALLSAGERSCVEGDPLDCRQAVVAGDEVPFNGQLMTPRRAARLAVGAGQCQDRIALEISRAVGLVMADLAAEKLQRANDREHATLQVNLLKETLEGALERAEPSVLEHPLLWLAIGIVTTAAAVGLTVAILDSTRPQVVTIPATSTTSAFSLYDF